MFLPLLISSLIFILSVTDRDTAVQNSCTFSRSIPPKFPPYIELYANDWREPTGKICINFAQQYRRNALTSHSSIAVMDKAKIND